MEKKWWRRLFNRLLVCPFAGHVDGLLGRPIRNFVPMYVYRCRRCGAWRREEPLVEPDARPRDFPWRW